MSSCRCYGDTDYICPGCSVGSINAFASEFNSQVEDAFDPAKAGARLRATSEVSGGVLWLFVQLLVLLIRGLTILVRHIRYMRRQGAVSGSEPLTFGSAFRALRTMLRKPWRITGIGIPFVTLGAFLALFAALAKSS